MNKITNPLSKLTKKTKITIIIITIILLGVTVLYQTFAISSNISGNNDNYTVTLNTDSIVKVPSNSNKTVYFKIRNNNKGTVKYGVGYKGTNIVVKVYSDSESPNTGTISESESKFIKLYIENTSSSESSVSLISVLGYENGGDLIPEEGYTLVTEIKSTKMDPVNLVTYINELYKKADKTTVNSSQSTYNYATSANLMNGGEGTFADNIRYYGANPNNYIYFNCSDYSNQSDSTCEKWRIIGVFDGQVKIIRNETIGDYAWDTKDNYGVNDWSDSDLMKLLNGGYESLSTNGSLYWNSQSGTCFSQENKGKGECDFTSTGIKNNETKQLISEVTYNLGGVEVFDTASYVEDAYRYERNKNVYGDHAVTWKGKIALAYPSDYGYAADLSFCNQTLFNYYDSTCVENNWMFNVATNNGSSYGWLLTPASNTSSNALNVMYNGSLSSSEASMTSNILGVSPVLHLVSDVAIKAGTGTELDPYQLS